jgi:hypothetical protein
MARKEWARLTINLEPDQAKLARERAKTRRQSVAGYLQSLIDDDLARAAESPTRYEVSAKPGIQRAVSAAKSADAKNSSKAS